MKLKAIAIVAFVLLTVTGIAWKFVLSAPDADPLSVIVPEHATEFDHEHPGFTKILGVFVKDQQVNYAAIKANSDGLRTYLGQLAAVDENTFNGWTKNQRLAYLINLYNAATIQLVVQKYPIDSIKDIGNVAKGPWDQQVVPIFGERVTLNHIEHDLIRAHYDEPRAHFALVCASVGCPPIRSEAFVSERLEQQMDEQGRLFFATPSKNRVDADEGTLFLSPIFKWFKKDFSDKAGSVEKFVAPYFPETDRESILSGKLETRFTDYDWSLNKQ